MAKEQWKKIGVTITAIGLIVSVLGSVVLLAYTGGTSIAVVKGDITSVKANSLEDRATLASHTTQIEELKGEVNEAKLRDERIAGQYSKIESYMRNESEKTKGIITDLKEYRKEHEAQVESNRKEQQSRTEAIIKIQTQVENLERVD